MVNVVKFEGIPRVGAGNTSVDGVGTDIEEISGRTEDGEVKVEVKVGTTEANKETRSIEPLITRRPAEREVEVGTCDRREAILVETWGTCIGLDLLAPRRGMVGLLNTEVEVGSSSDPVTFDDSVKEESSVVREISVTMSGIDVGIDNSVVDVSLGLSVDVVSAVEGGAVSSVLDVW